MEDVHAPLFAKYARFVAAINTKFGQRDDRWNRPRVEHALLELARECGLDAAESRVERIGDRDVLLVRRFDREWTGMGTRAQRPFPAATGGSRYDG